MTEENNQSNQSSERFFKINSSRRDKFISCPYCNSVLYNYSQTCKYCNSVIEVQKTTVKQEIAKLVESIKKYFEHYFFSDVKSFFQHKAVKFFIVFNISVFFITGFTNSLFKPYPVAKFFLSNAFAVNTLYIFPLSKVFGWDNILTKPFYLVRGLLYHTGMFFLPENEGEREVWWFVIRFSEYDDLVGDLAAKIYRNRATTRELKKCKKVMKFNDEVYEHIIKLATMKIKDEHCRSRRYNHLVLAIYKYQLVAMVIGENDKDNKKNPNNFYLKGDQLTKFETLLNLFMKQTEYIKKEEPEAYDYFKNDTYNFFLDDIILNNYSTTLIYRLLIQKNLIELKNHKILYEINKEYTNIDDDFCDSKLLHIYGDSHERLHEYLSDPRLLKEKSLIRISQQPSTEKNAILGMCADRPHLKSVTESYTKKGREEIIRRTNEWKSEMKK